MKKLVSAMLALCMIFSMSVGAFAAAIAVETDKTVIEAGESVTVTLKLDTQLTEVRMLETRFYYNPNYFEYPTGDAGANTEVILGRAARATASSDRVYATLNFVDKESKGKTFGAGTFYTLTFVSKTDITEKVLSEFEFVVIDTQANVGSVPVTGNAVPVSVEIEPRVPRLVISADTSKAYVGKQFTVTLGIKNNPGIVSIAGFVDYDKNIFELTSENIKNECSELGNFTPSDVDGMKSLQWYSSNIAGGNVEGDLTLATLTFTVKENATLGDTDIKFIFDTSDFGGSTNFDEESIEWKDAEKLTVKVYKSVLGDVTGDGKITNNDVIRLLKYMARLTTDIDFYGADVTQDGKITNNDVIRLLKYMARLISSFD